MTEQVAGIDEFATLLECLATAARILDKHDHSACSFSVRAGIAALEHLTTANQSLMAEVGDKKIACSTFQTLLRSAEQEVSDLRSELMKEEAGHSKTIDQRDRAEHFADELSNHIGTHFGTDVGEHSSMNCPWQNALEIIQQPQALHAEEVKP